MRTKRAITIAAIGTTVVVAAAGCGTSTSHTPSSSGKITITAQLPPATGAITSSYNAPLEKLTKEYEQAHPNVTVDWMPDTQTSITTGNASLVTEASGGDAPDIVQEQYNPLLSGSIPAGILQNLKPYLEQPNPYVSGNKKWIDLWDSSILPYMTAPNGSMGILLGSNVETGWFYSKADFAKAGIKSAPTTWAEFIQDLSALKSAGFTPMIFASGGSCNPSWFERWVSTSLLNPVLSKFMTDHSQVTSGKDVVSGIEKGVISMSNPRYAEIWKLLAQLAPYEAKGGASYDACSSFTAVSPPLPTVQLLTGGKVAMVWAASTFIPELNTLGYSGKYGVFSEPVITKATTPYASGVSPKGVIGGPNGNGEVSVTTEKADHTMTPAKTKVVMNYLEWLYTPAHIGAAVEGWGHDGSFIPTLKGAPLPHVAGLAQLVPSSPPPTVVDIALDDVLSTETTNTGLRLVSAYASGSMSYSSFASQWQTLLQTGAQTYATENHISLSSLK